MTNLLIQNGRIVDPANDREETADLLIRDGKIAEIGANLSADGVQTFDASNRVVVPGLVDIHSHWREPGHEGAETIATGSRAAAVGGFTSVVLMANTLPVIDSAADVMFIQERAASKSVVHVFPIAAVTKEQKGEEIVEFGDLVHAGVVGFSDDGQPIMNNEIMRRALEYCAMFNVPILDHCGDLDLAGAGGMREGRVSTRLGLRGIPSVAEIVQVARDVVLAEYVGGHIHIQHVSSRRSVSFIERAKQRDVKVTAEVTPHHLALTHEALDGYNANAKMNPPLGSETDRQALIQGLVDGVIDCIATDHAPHSATDKDKTLPEAPFGVIGLETAFPVCHTELVAGGKMSLALLIEKMAVNPARIMHLPKGTLSVGADGDVAILDPDWEGSITEEMFQSRARNTPFLGRRVQGRVAATVVAGRLVSQDGKALV
jgi:dihydroorotase